MSKQNRPSRNQQKATRLKQRGLGGMCTYICHIGNTKLSYCQHSPNLVQRTGETILYFIILASSSVYMYNVEKICEQNISKSTL